MVIEVCSSSGDETPEEKFALAIEALAREHGFKIERIK